MQRTPGSLRCAPLLLASLLVAASALEPAAVRAQSQAGTSVVIPPGTRPLQMKVRRLPDSVELVIEGVGTAPQLQ
jgi:hypothetical protein